MKSLLKKLKNFVNILISRLKSLMKYVNHLEIEIFGQKTKKASLKLKTFWSRGGSGMNEV